MPRIALRLSRFRHNPSCSPTYNRLSRLLRLGPNRRGPLARTASLQDETGRFVSKVLGSTELLWTQIFAKDGKTYRAPVLVLYKGATQASCGGAAQSAMGPFYCPLSSI